MPEEPRPVAPETIPPGEISALLEELARAPAGVGGAWESWLRPGAVVGRFELVRELGRGGFGVVWEARDRQLGRSVAFKAVRPGDRAGAREERLLREAEAAARLSHPNVVTLHEAGQCEHGPYLVLELLRGQTLSGRLAQGPVPVREALRIAVEIARALAHAHAEGVVHRDLKPGNVFLCDDGRVKVLDLGLAHAFGRRRADGGTPEYMAPEQSRGAPEDERTDVFALGLVLYRMLAGVLPYAGDRGRWVLGTRAAPRLEIPDVPALGTLVARMLSRDPVERPRDGAEVLAALLAFQGELDRTPSSSSSGLVRARRAGRNVAAIAVVGLVGLAGAAALAWRLTSRTPETVGAPSDPGAGSARPALVVADVENATGEKDLDGLSRILMLSVEPSRKVQVLSRSRIQGLSRRSGDAPLARIDEETAREAARRASARAVVLPAVHRVGGTYVVELRAEDPATGSTLFIAREGASSKDGVVPALDRLSDRIRREMGEASADLEAARVQLGRLEGRSLEAYDLWLRAVDAQSQYGELGPARKLLLRAVEIDPGFAPAHLSLADHALRTNRPEEAAPHLAAARQGRDRLPGRERLLVELLLAREDGAPAGELDRQATAIVDRFPTDKLVLLNAAQVRWVTLGDRAGAEALYRRGLALDPGLMCMAGDLVNLLHGEGRTREAVEVARRAVADRPSAPNKMVLALALAADGSLAEAVDWAREAIRVAAGASFYVTAFAGDVLARGGAVDEAEAEYRRVASSAEYEGERQFALWNLVGLLAIQGRVAEARQHVGQVPPGSRASPEFVAFLAGTGRPRRHAPAALEAVRAAPPGPFTPAMLAFHGDLAAAAERGRGLDATSPGGRYLRALQDAAAGRTDEAVAAFRALASEPPVLGRHQFLYLAGEALLEAGRPAEALEALRPATGMAMPLFRPLDVAANFPRAVLVRARALEQMGRAGDALAELDRVLSQWARADADLPLLADAREMQGRLSRGR
jgi:tetratricopeptide (TPR) repeat protein